VNYRENLPQQLREPYLHGQNGLAEDLRTTTKVAMPLLSVLAAGRRPAAFPRMKSADFNPADDFRDKP
jgi:hypothetical protein